MPEWTPQQRQAIEARNRTILVSAAAGSGKTAVLVERIVSLLREGAHLNRMMICTFTRAAAGEMRQRLAETLQKKLAEEPDVIGAALDELESAQISTIHGFCQKLLRQEFQAAGIDPLFKIASESQSSQLFTQAIREAMNELLAAQPRHEGFAALTDAVEQKEIMAWTEKLHRFLMSLYHPMEWLHTLAVPDPDQPDASQPWFEMLKKKPEQMLEQAEKELAALLQAARDPLLPQSRRDDAEALRAEMDEIRRAWAESPEALQRYLSTHTRPRMAAARRLDEDAKRADDAYKKIREAYKKAVDDDLADTIAALTLPAGQEAKERTQQSSMLSGLALLTETTHQRYSELKREAGVLDFSDMEQLTMGIMEQPDIREKQQNEYDWLFVDECQDVSAIQDALIAALQGEHCSLFMVGDVKQSIYRFRQADPTLFMQKMRTFSMDENAFCRRIDLQQNFRSRDTVLDAANHVFRRIMRADATEIDYTPQDELISGRHTENDVPTQIIWLPPEQFGNGEDEPHKASRAADRVAAEALCLAERIHAIHREGQFDYRDMVVLMPQLASDGMRCRDILQEQGIPVYYDGGSSYYALREVREVCQLLACIDNRCQDLPLISAMKTSPFLFTDEELAQVRLCKTGRGVPFWQAFDACCEDEHHPLSLRCRDMLQRLNGWRFAADVMPLADFIWSILRLTGIYAAAGALPGGEACQGNLALLCEQAADFEASHPATLHSFLTWVEGMRQTESDKMSAHMLGENENLVRLMTMHKSKGLQFPVVFLAGLSKTHSIKSGELQTHSRLGLCMSYYNPALRIKRDTRRTEAWRLALEQQQRAEKCRLLYVAMTRASERLICLCSGEPQKEWGSRVDAWQVSQAKGMSSWLMSVLTEDAPPELLAAIRQSGGTAEEARQANEALIPVPEKPFMLRVWRACPLPPEQEEAQKASDSPAGLEAYLQHVLGSDTETTLRDQWMLLRIRPEAVPLKTSVTALTHGQPVAASHSEAEEHALPETDETRADKAAPSSAELTRRPAFMEEKQISGAAYGTINHKVLAMTDLKALRDAAELRPQLECQLHAMVARGLLNEAESHLANVFRLTGFYLSPIGRRVLASPTVKREWAFNLLRDDRGNLVQGVIDCTFIEQGRWVLLDYKTDRLEDDDAFITRYGDQLRWYARALKTITGVDVSEAWLYSLHLGRSIRVL